MSGTTRRARRAIVFVILCCLAIWSVLAVAPGTSSRSTASNTFAVRPASRTGSPGEPASPSPRQTLDSGNRTIRETDSNGVSDVYPAEPPPEAPSACPQDGELDGTAYRSSDDGDRRVDPCGVVSTSSGAPEPTPAAPATDVKTIDRMTTSIGYSDGHPAGGSIELFGAAVTYTLDDGSSWASGAGSYSSKRSYLDHVEVDGSTVRYVLFPPADGKTYEQTDYDSGNHSAQGALGTPASLVLTATIGSTTAVLTGSVPILSNDPTWYGEPRFNYYSTIPGANVPYELDYVLVGGATWQPDSFTRAFSYTCTGWVDFAHPTSVPRLSTLHILGSGQVPPNASVTYAAIAHYDSGVERDVASRAVWDVSPSGLAQVDSGVLSTGTFPSDMQPLNLRATYTWDGVTLTDQKTVLGRSTPTVTSKDTWPMYQDDERHTGYVASQFETDTFSLRWTKQISSSGLALNPVAAADGRVFISVNSYFGTGTGLTAVDAVGGEVLWTQSFGRPFSINPASWAYGNVYLQTCDNSGDTWLHAFDAATGERIFRVPFGAQWERYYAPTVYDGTVYVDGGTYGGMYAFDAYSGTQRWFAPLQQYDEWTPGVSGDLAYAYVGSYAPGLYVLDRHTGAQRIFIPDPHFSWNGWSMDLAPLVLENGDVVAIHDHRMLRFGLTARSLAWERTSSFAGQPSYAHGVLYAADGARVVAVDATSGAELWSWTPPSGTPRTPFIVSDSHLFVSTDSTVYAVDLLTQDASWSYPAGGSLALEAGNLYIARSNGTLVAIAAAPYAPAPPVSIEIRGPDTAVEFTSVPYKAFVQYADGRVRDRTRTALWSVRPSNYASIGIDGMLSVQEMLDMTQDVSISASYTEADVTVQASIPVRLKVSVSLPEFVERNRVHALAIQASVLTELDEAIAREEAMLRALGPPPGSAVPVAPDPVRAAIARAIAAGTAAKSSVQRAIDELEQAAPGPTPPANGSLGRPALGPGKPPSKPSLAR